MIERSQRITDYGIWIQQGDLAARAKALGHSGCSDKSIARNAEAAGWEKDTDGKRVLWLVPFEHLQANTGILEWQDRFILPDGSLDLDLIRVTSGGMVSADAVGTLADAEQYRQKCEVLSARYDEMSDTCRTQADKLLEYESNLASLKKQVADLVAERDAERARSADIQRLYDQQKELLSASINNAHPELADDVGKLANWANRTQPKLDELSKQLPDIIHRLQTLEQKLLPTDAKEDADLDKYVGQPWTAPDAVQPSRLRHSIFGAFFRAFQRV
jgi:hypothetical protein